ncbi:MAG: hypothetical protein ACREUE_02050 [Panacagrimonas sp.]
MIRLSAVLLCLLLALPAIADPAQQIVDGQAALQAGDADAAARLWEEAAIADVQESYHLLVSLYESGPDPSPVQAFKWAWIGQARTWEPTLTKRASQDYDRLQDSVRRDVRQQGREMAEAWLKKHPRPSPP